MPAILKAGNHFTVPTARNSGVERPVDWSTIKGLHARIKVERPRIVGPKPNPFIAMHCAYLRPVTASSFPSQKLDLILRVVCAVWGVNRIDVLSERRNKLAAHPRQAFCLLATEFTTWSVSDIGRFLKRDHTTVMHAIAVSRERVACEFQERLDQARGHIINSIGEQDCG